MKRTLRSRNSCSSIQNIFDKLTYSEFSDLVVEVIPPEIIKKLAKKKTILCEDLLNFQMNIKPTQTQLQRMKTATKLLKQKCEGGFEKYRKIQQKFTTQNNSFFDCLINQQESGRKMVKYEPFPIEFKQNHKNNFEYKIEYNNGNEDKTFGTTDNLPKLGGKRIDTVSQQKELYQITQKSIKASSTTL